MKHMLTSALVASLLAGCGGSAPAPSGRIQQPAGGFSYITPEGWNRTRLPGIEFIIVTTAEDQGIRPNIFVDFVLPSSSLDEAAVRLIEHSTNSHLAYEVLSKEPFGTESGLSGIKVTAQRRNKEQLPLATYHYILMDADRAIAITCTCARSAEKTYEPVFDAAMRTLEAKQSP